MSKPLHSMVAATRAMSLTSVVIAFLACSNVASAALQESINTSVDGFNGHIGTISEVAGPGTFDVQFVNYQNSNWAFKRAYCGGDISTYATAASGGMPNVVNQTVTSFGLSVTLISTGTTRTYRFSGVSTGQAQNFCFVSGDGYRSTTLTSTAAATPTPVISNIRIVNDAAIAGGRNICIDYTPNSTPAGVSSFDWIENGIAVASGDATSLWTTFTCWNRSSALVDGQTYTVRLRYNGATGSQTSNQLSITVPDTLGDISNLRATNNDASIPGQIRATWTAAPGATYYNVYVTSLSNTTNTTALISVSDTSSVYVYVAACNSSGCRPWQSTPGAAAPVPVHNSTFVSQSIAGVTNPTSLTLVATRQYPAIHTFTNSGNTIWSATGANPHLLGSQAPVDNSLWGPNRIGMSAATTNVGAQATFNSTVTPASVGQFTYQWRTLVSPSSWFGATSMPVTINVLAAPTIATNVTATMSTFSDKVRVTWTSGDGAGVSVFRAAPNTSWPSTGLGQSSAPQGWSLVCTFANTQTTCDDTTATPGVEYDYRVLTTVNAHTSNGNFDNSVTSASARGARAAPIATAPTLTLNSRVNGVELSWPPVASAATYEVERASATVIPYPYLTSQYLPLQSASGTTTSVLDQILVGGVTQRGIWYAYRVRAVNAAGPGPWSLQSMPQVQRAIPLPAVSAASATQGTLTSALSLQWQMPALPSGYSVNCVRAIHTFYSEGEYQELPSTCLSQSPHVMSYADPSFRTYRIEYSTVNGSVSEPATVSGYANVASESLGASLDGSNEGSQCGPNEYGYFVCNPTPSVMVAFSNRASENYLLRVRDQNLAIGQPESFTFSVIQQPPSGHGVCTISGSDRLQWSPATEQAYAGATTCVVRVVDRGGASVEASITVQVSAHVPSAPTQVSATDGTLTRKVRITWEPSQGAFSYRVLKNDVFLAATSNSWFEEQGVESPTVASYRIEAVSAAGGRSTPSDFDTGFANLPPTATSAVLSTVDDTASSPTVPQVSDPNVGDQHLFAIVTQPANGVASVVSGALVYLPNAGYSGTDTFTFSATDRANESVTGTASATVSCRVPTIGSFTPSPTLIATDSVITASYNANRCNTNLRARLTIRSASGDVSFETTISGLNAGSDRTVSFDVLPISVSGSYTVDISLVSEQGVAQKQATLNVVPVTAPQFFTRTASPTAGEYYEVEVRTASGANCPLVRTVSEATADTSKCLIEWQASPNWSQRDVASGNLMAFGIAQAGSHEFVFTLSKFDRRGQRFPVGTPAHVVAVATEQESAFVLDAERWTVVQFLSAVNVTPRQTGGTSCRLVSTESEARSVANQGLAVCLVQFTGLPEGLALRAAATPVVVGRARNVGVQLIEARFTRFFQRGLSRVIGLASSSFTVTAPAIGYEFSPAPKAEYVAGSDVVNLSINASTKSPAKDVCPPTSDEAVALTTYQGSGTVRCLVEWIALPSGISARPGTIPSVSGVPTQAGASAVTWRASIKPATGELVEVASGSLPLNVVVPTPPTFAITGGRKLNDGRYLAPRGMGMVAKLELATNVAGQVDYLITDDLGGSVSFKRVRTGSSRVIEAGMSALWTTRTITVRASYSDYPSIFTEQTLQALTVPYDFAANVYLEAPEIINDTQTVTVKASVGRIGATGLAYDGETMGDYSVHIARRNDDGSLTAITPPKRVSTDGLNGRITFDGISAEGYLVLKLVAVAIVTSPDAAFVRTLESSNRTVQVVKGTDIEATLTVSRKEGVAPMTPVFALSMDRANLVALGAIEWWLKRDQGNFAIVPRENGAQLRLPISEPGTYQVKAKLKNKNSQRVAETNTETVVSYLVPKLTFAGPTYLLSGLPASVQIDATLPCAQGRCPIEDGLIAWTVSGAGYTAPMSGTGRSVPLNATSRGAIVVQATARAPTSSPDDVFAFARERFTTIVAEDPKPSVAVSGPRVVETGVTNTFVATVGTPWRQQLANGEVKGEWTLPNNSTVQGTTLSFALPANETRAQLRYTAWIDGLKDRTSSTAVIDVNAWTYAFPSFNLRLTQTTTAAPSYFKLEVVPDDVRLATVMRAQGAAYTYEWAAPTVLTNARAEGSLFSATARVEGSYPVSVTVRDARGNQQVLSRTIQAIPAVPMSLSLTTSQSHPAGRVPLDVTARIVASGGHPDDRVSGYFWTINGNAIASTTPGVAQFRITEPGNHQLVVGVATRMGSELTAEKSLVSVANQPPTCVLNTSVSASNTALVVAQCRDTDGRIVRYQWKVNGALVSSNADRISFAHTPGAAPFNVEMTATDDSGASVTLTRLVP